MTAPRHDPGDYARDGEMLQGAALEARLLKTWSRPPGFIGWLTTVDHKEIAHRYIVTAFIFLAFGGIASLAMPFLSFISVTRSCRAD